MCIIMWTSMVSYSIICYPIGHFQVPLCLCIKASLSAKPFLWKCLWFAWKWNCMQNSFSYELTSDSFAQPKQHVQCLVFPRLQRQMPRNLSEDKDAENTKQSTKIAKQIWKDFLLEKNVEEPSEKRDLALILKSFYVDARKKRSLFLLIGKPKNIEIRTQLTLQSSTKYMYNV